MAIFLSVYDLLITVAFFLLGLSLSIFLRKHFKLSLVLSISLYIYHSFFSLLFTIFIINNGGDALGYYNASLKLSQGHDLNGVYIGSGAVVHIIAPFTNILMAPFVASCMIFHIFGSIGLLAFAASLKSITQKSSIFIKCFSSLLVFLPSISFWSAGLGKDALSFMAICLCLWALLKIRQRLVLFVFAVFVMGLVRPHMAALIIIAMISSLLFDKGLSKGMRLSLFTITVAVALALIPFALNYAGVNILQGTVGLENYILKRQQYNLSGGSSIDISSMSYPMQLFTYIFRPLPFEAHNISALMSSLDNMILFVFFICAIYNRVKNGANIQMPFNKYFMYFYILLSTSILATTTANLGIAVRQKWMIAPILIFLLFTFFHAKPKKRPLRPL